jgi:DNA-binding transcriptional LysR family regulator
LCIYEQVAVVNRKLDQDWDDFRYFLAVARAGTLSAAAVPLGTEHTTVARHIRALESALHRNLFNKSNDGYRLTEAGEHLLARAGAIESACIAALASDEGESVSGSVRIGASDGFGSVFLAPRMGALTRRHPGLQVEILAIARLFRLSKREADIAIGLSPPQHLRVVSRRLTDYRLYVYASRAYLETAPPILAAEDFRRHPFISFVEELVFAPELNYFGAIGDDVAAPIRSTNLLAQVHATLVGNGLCILPAFVASAYPALVAVLPEQLSLTRSLHMHVHEDNRKVPHIREVAGFIAAEVDRNHFLFDPQLPPDEPSSRRS